mmetsp:Transcript_38923/g.123546  ORF Transcript_38923/g.123546 Transcript_38923/m.123546 type:complete len:213 (+) Transcript_38923:222-860(+)
MIQLLTPLGSVKMVAKDRQQTDSQTNRPTDKRTDRQTDRRTDRQSGTTWQLSRECKYPVGWECVLLLSWDQSTAVPKAHRTTSASAKDTPMLRHAPTLRTKRQPTATANVSANERQHASPPPSLRPASEAMSSSSGSGNLKMPAMPLSCASCWPLTCCEEKMWTVAPLSLVVSAIPTYCLRVETLAFRNRESATISTDTAPFSTASFTCLGP